MEPEFKEGDRVKVKFSGDDCYFDMWYGRKGTIQKVILGKSCFILYDVKWDEGKVHQKVDGNFPGWIGSWFEKIPDEEKKVASNTTDTSKPKRIDEIYLPRF